MSKKFKNTCSKMTKKLLRTRYNEIERGKKMEEFKSGFVTLIGKTNVGKSTLLNALVGEKVAITANKAQTTRTEIRAIVNRKNAQIIFLDTPGIHRPKNKLGETMLETAYGSMKEVDVILFLVDATKKEITKGDTILLEKIKEAKKPTILLLNKIDLIVKEELLPLIQKYRQEYDFTAVIPISAMQNNKKEIETILSEIEKNLKPGPAYYDIEEYTDQTMRDLVEETIREKALRLLKEEIPHEIYVECEKMKRTKTQTKEPIYQVEAVIYCNRNSHKGIIIGKGGAMLKKIGTYAREDLEKMLGTKVNLKLWVKVKEDWQNNDYILKKFKKQD